jgi:hypothetical protein
MKLTNINFVLVLLVLLIIIGLLGYSFYHNFNYNYNYKVQEKFEENSTPLNSTPLNFTPSKPEEIEIFNKLSEYSNIVNKTSPSIVGNTQEDIGRILPEIRSKQNYLEDLANTNSINLKIIQYSIQNDIDKIKKLMDGSVILPIAKPPLATIKPITSTTTTTITQAAPAAQSAPASAQIQAAPEAQAAPVAAQIQAAPEMYAIPAAPAPQTIPVAPIAQTIPEMSAMSAMSSTPTLYATPEMSAMSAMSSTPTLYATPEMSAMSAMPAAPSMSATAIESFNGTPQFPIPTSIKIFEKFADTNDWRTEWNNKLSSIYNINDNSSSPRDMNPVVNTAKTEFYILKNRKLEENLNNTSSQIIKNNLNNISNKLKSQWLKNKF